MSEQRRALRWLLHAWPLFYGIVSAALFAFVIYPRQGVIHAQVDLNGFGELARNLAEGRGFSFNYGPTIRRAPLYPYLGAALLELFGQPTTGIPDAAYYRPILVANCVFFGLTCLVVRSLTESLFGYRAAVLAVLMCPFIPQSLRYVGMTEVETLMGFFIVLLAATGRLFAARPDARSGAIFGVSAALATLTKPVVLLYPVGLIALAFLYWRKTAPPLRSRLVGSAVALACFAVLLVPWSLRNQGLTGGKFKNISSNAPGEFLRGYVNAQPKYYLLRQDFGGSGPQAEKWDPEANAFEERIFRARGATFYRYTVDSSGRAIIEPPPPPGVNSASIEAEKDRIEGAEVKDRLLREPGAFLHKFAVQSLTFWYIVETRTKSLLVGSIALTMLVLSGIGVWRAHRQGALVWPVVTIVVYVNLLYAALLAFARYSMPLFPTLAVLAAGGILTVAERIPALRRFTATPGRTQDQS